MTYFDMEQLGRGMSAISRMVQGHKEEVDRLQSLYDTYYDIAKEREARIEELEADIAALRAELDAVRTELKAANAWQPITGRHGKPGMPPGEYIVLEPYFGGWSARTAYLDEGWFRLGRDSVIYMHDDLRWGLRLPDFPARPPATSFDQF